MSNQLLYKIQIFNKLQFTFAIFFHFFGVLGFWGRWPDGPAVPPVGRNSFGTAASALASSLDVPGTILGRVAIYLPP